MATRRDFLKTSAAILAGGRLVAGNGDASAKPRVRLGAQLWTVRKLAEADLNGTLRKIAALGYKEVEFAGYYGHSPADIRKMLDSAGLTSPSVHIRFEDLANIGPALDAAEIIGHKYLIFAWIPENERTRDGYRRIIRALNAGGEKAAARGIKLGYHNYSYDFLATAGERPYDRILAETNPALVTMEMDVYWILAGGGDPLQYLRRHAGRYELIHIKDMLGDAAHTMVDVGDGVVNWRRVLTAARNQGAKHFFIEHDEPRNPIETLRRSFNYISSLHPS